MTSPAAYDELITSHLRDALALIDVRALDHLIVAGRSATLAERDLVRPAT